MRNKGGKEKLNRKKEREKCYEGIRHKRNHSTLNFKKPFPLAVQIMITFGGVMTFNWDASLHEHEQASWQNSALLPD
jgi:hypothetical protein